jgi:protoheme IX farnesyltransferase
LFSFIALAVSLLPAIGGFAGTWYVAGAVVLGLTMISVAVRFAALRTTAGARWMLWSTLAYLPLLMMLLLLDRAGG